METNRTARLFWIGIFGLVQGLRASGTRDSLSVHYQRGIQTDLWAGAFGIERFLPSGVKMKFGDAFSSSRLQVMPGPDKWKDQNQVDMEVSRPFHPGWLWLVQGNSFSFSDKQTGYNNDIQTHYLGMGCALQTKTVSLPVQIGVKSDRRYSRTDRGWSFQAGLDAPAFSFSGYTNRLSLQAEGDNLRRRKNAGLSLTYAMHRQFFTDTNDSLFVSLRRQRRDYYVSEAGDVESWDESRQDAENVLMYRLFGGMRIRFKGSLTSRSLKISQVTGAGKGVRRERRDFGAEGSVHAGFASRAFLADIGVDLSDEEQSYRFAKSATYSPYSGGIYSVLPDNRSHWTTLSLYSHWGWSRSDTISVRAGLQKLAYDTPDPANVDDRDDLRFWISLQEMHAFSPELWIRLVVDAYTLHLVYLNGEKSADNNRTRIFRFTPSVGFSPSNRLRLVQSAEVMANYVDYDFETLFPGIRSFLYRKFRLDDSLQVRLHPALAFHLAQRIELDENGKLIWNRWLEEKLLERKSWTFSVEAAFMPVEDVTVAPGYSVYRREGYQYGQTSASGAGEGRERTQEFISSGPTLRLTCRMDRLVLTGFLSSLQIRSLGMPAQRTTRIDVALHWRF